MKKSKGKFSLGLNRVVDKLSSSTSTGSAHKTEAQVELQVGEDGSLTFFVEVLRVQKRLSFSTKAVQLLNMEGGIEQELVFDDALQVEKGIGKHDVRIFRKGAPQTMQFAAKNDQQVRTIISAPSQLRQFAHQQEEEEARRRVAENQAILEQAVAAEEGKGVAKNDMKAMQLYQQLIDANVQNPEPYWRYARLVKEGRVADEDHNRAVTMFEKASALGWNIPSDIQAWIVKTREAARLARMKAIEEEQARNREAQCKQRADMEEAKRRRQEMDEQVYNKAVSCRNAGDYNTAFTLFEQSAANGHPTAQGNAIALFLGGKYTPSNPKEFYAKYDKIAADGDKSVAPLLSALNKQGVRKCRNCKEIVLESENYDEACVYHRSDQYAYDVYSRGQCWWQCCKQGIDSKGCMTGRHAY